MRIKRILIPTAASVSFVVLFLAGTLGLLNIHLVDLFPVHMQGWASIISRWLVLPMALFLLVPVAKVVHKRIAIAIAARKVSVIPPRDNQNGLPFDEEEIVEVINPQGDSKSVEFDILEISEEEVVEDKAKRLEESTTTPISTEKSVVKEDPVVVQLHTDSSHEVDPNSNLSVSEMEKPLAKKDPAAVQLRVNSFHETSSDFNLPIDSEKEVSVEVKLNPDATTVPMKAGQSTSLPPVETAERMAEIDFSSSESNKTQKRATNGLKETPVPFVERGRSEGCEPPDPNHEEDQDPFPAVTQNENVLEETQHSLPVRPENIFLSLKKVSSEGGDVLIAVKASHPLNEDLSLGIQFTEILDDFTEVLDDLDDEEGCEVYKSSTVINRNCDESKPFRVSREKGVTKVVQITPFKGYGVNDNDFPKYVSSIGRKVYGTSDIIFRPYEVDSERSKIIVTYL